MEKKKDKKKVKKNVAFTIDVGLYERFHNNYPFLNRSTLVDLFLNEISSQISEEEF